jgi:hypothetical protein
MGTNVIGNTNFEGWSGASIIIDINSDTQIICRAPKGALPAEARWDISKVTLLSDSRFGGLPYRYEQYPIHPKNNKISDDWDYIADNALGYTYV